MSSQGSQTSMSFREEAIWGEKDPGEFTGVNFESEDLAFNIQNQESKTIRPDRQTAEIVQIGADASGGFVTEFQATNVDKLLPGSLWDTDWHYIDGVGATSKITAGLTASNLDFSFVVETGAGVGGILTLGSSVVHDIIVGQHFVISNVGGNAANSGLMQAKSVAGNVIQVDKPLATEVVESIAYLTGDRIRNGVTKHSYSLERGHIDISQFFLYLGAVPNVSIFTVDSGNPVKFNQSFVAKDETLAQTTAAASLSALSTLPIMNTAVSVGELAIDGTILTACLIQSVDITFDNKAEGKTGIGVLGFCDVVGQSIMCSGNITMYFNDETYYNKYKNSEYFSLTIPMADTTGNIYVLHMPKVKFLTGTTNVSDKDSTTPFETTYQAIIGADGYTFQIVRALDSGIVFNGTIS